MDGPCTDVLRQAIGFGKLCLTDFKISISHSAREKQVRRAYMEADVSMKWEQTAWARRISQKVKRGKLSDFDRFKLRALRQQVRTPLEHYSLINARPPPSEIPHYKRPIQHSQERSSSK